MHYANGREAKAGDVVVNFDPSRGPLTGILHNLMPAANQCNAYLQPLNYTMCVTVGECLHIDDYKAAFGKGIPESIIVKQG